MYVRKHDDQELTFVVSGMLWKRSLVMRDLETESLWSHLLGKSMDGSLQGTRLETVPALLTDWATWKQRHPDTSVVLMSRTARMFNSNMYRTLENFLVGMATINNSKAWRFHHLKKQPVVNDLFAEQPVLVYFDKQSSTPFVYDRQLNDQVLSFASSEAGVTDKETESSWDLKTGVATDGQLKGQRLRPLVGIPSFKRSWDSFFPDSDYWKPRQ